MHIDITAKNLELTPAIEAHLREKMENLSKFVQKYEELGELELKATVERTTAHHHKGEVFRASADLVMPHKNLHAEEEDADAYVAIDAVKRKLQIEIEKYKQD
jgi:ribosomal subunit interface protein